MSELGKYQLAKGWSWATIPQLSGKAGVFIDGDWVESKDQDPDGNVRLIQLADIGDGVYRDKSDRFMTTAKADELGCTFLKEGDVLIARMPDPLGRACLFPGDAKPSVTVVDVAIVRSGDGEFDHGWLACFVNAHPFRSAISGLQAGSTRKRISRGNLATIPLPVPPFPEQRRIVAEIEKQFTRLEAGVAALRRVQANIKRYRAAVLNAACEGRLVPSNVSAWKQLKVSEMGEVITGNTPPTNDKENLGDELPFFKPTDLDAGYNVREARQYLSAKGAKHARKLQANSVLVTCIGATIGKTGFARVECATNQQINALVVSPLMAIPQWAFWLFSSPNGQQQIQTNASATTLPILNKSKFEALEFPIPPLAEQTRIVAEVERRLSVVEELERLLSANLQRATRLRQSILQKAFTGDLVPQNPSDEPAETLLKRINDLPDEAKLAKRKTKSKDQNIMPSKPVTTLEELLQRLDSIGGAAAPDRLLATAGLGEEVEKFFDLLREGRNNGALIVPTGTSGDIKRNSHEN